MGRAMKPTFQIQFTVQFDIGLAVQWLERMGKECVMGSTSEQNEIEHPLS